LCGACRYERSPDRVGTRAGHHSRQSHTRVGPVELNVPKLRGLPFEAAVIERYRRRETSVEEALVQMDLAGGHAHRVEGITEALWGTPVSSSTWQPMPGPQGRVAVRQRGRRPPHRSAWRCASTNHSHLSMPRDTSVRMCRGNPSHASTTRARPGGMSAVARFGHDAAPGVLMF
jgi:hypothetical protein